MHRPPGCRRTHDRFPLDPTTGGTIEFLFPGPTGAPCAMRLRDLSRSGLSFVLAHELPGLEVGDSLDHTCMKIAGREVRGDVLVMHLTPDDAAGAVCGALFYPADDVDILTLRAILGELEATGAEAASAR